MNTSPSPERITAILSQCTPGTVILASDLPVEPPKPSNQEIADTLMSLANRIMREDKLASQALIQAVEKYEPAKNCTWCGGAGGWERYEDGDIRFRICDCCDGLGKVGA
jgi:hypothetical protein